MTEQITMTCTCDDNCDDPCPMHKIENELQNRVIELENALSRVYRVRIDIRDKPGVYSIDAIVEALRGPCEVMRK